MSEGEIRERIEECRVGDFTADERLLSPHRWVKWAHYPPKGISGMNVSPQEWHFERQGDQALWKRTA